MNRRLRPPTESALGERTLELVRIPSPSGDEAALADRVAAILAEESAPAWIHRHERALVARYGDGGPHVILAGHLDTVPENEHPEPAIRDGAVVGLGSTDMKGGLAVMLAAGSMWPARPEKHTGSLTLVFYDCEEVDFSRNGLRRVLAAEPSLAGADLALLLEPTDNRVELGCQGTLHARVTFTGVAAHSARPWQGRNAVHLAAPFLTRVAGLPLRIVRDGPAVYREVVGVTVAEGGRARNVIPDRFTLNVNLRFPPDRTPAEAEAYLRTLVPESARMEVTDVAPAAPPRRDAPLLARFVEASGIEPRGKQGWTDVAQFAGLGIPAANFGPGLPELAHKRDELAPVANLLRAYEVLAGFLGLAGGAPS
jgi:succinyl-diaminopimelate desuccinylase